MTVWYASCVIGPFENQNGQAITVNSKRYGNMIDTCFAPIVERDPPFNRNTWLQQDRVTAHTARESMDILQALFPQRVIRWPSNLTQCVFFSVGIPKV